MRFAAPHFLHLLWIVPFLVIFYFIIFRQKRKAKTVIGDSALVEQMCDKTNYKIPRIKVLLMILTIGFVVTALARPQYGTKLESVERKSLDIVFILDVSKSMLAQDIKPSRLDRAKLEISSFIDRLRDDRVGICAFAGDAYVFCPLTMDYSTAKLFLEIMSPETMPKPGTNIGAAIRKAMDTFGEEDQKYKVCILITDGENLTGDPLEAANEAAQKGIRIYTVGLGTSAGEPIPEYDKYGNVQGYKRDDEENIVMSKLNEIILGRIALITNAKYVRANEKLGLDKIYSAISRLTRRELEAQLSVHYEDRFQYPLGLAIFCLVLGLMLSDRKGYIRLRIWRK
jgi:Ca-activated chloride channel family protein